MFVAVSYALGAARKAIILLGATKMLFNCFLPFFILRVLEKPATGWVDSLFVSLALLGRKVFAALFCRAGGGAMGLSSFLRRGGEGYFVKKWY